jgi:lipoprotein-releasing system ATP-binding protein
LLADEPTGDLDTRTAEAVFELIARLHAEHRLTSIVVTHNLDFAGRCDRILELRGGELKGGELQGGELQKNQPRGGENHRTSDVTKGAGRG